jgi:hypothetical protein
MALETDFQLGKHRTRVCVPPHMWQGCGHGTAGKAFCGAWQSDILPPAQKVDWKRARLTKQEDFLKTVLVRLG